MQTWNSTNHHHDANKLKSLQIWIDIQDMEQWQVDLDVHHFTRIVHRTSDQPNFLVVFQQMFYKAFFIWHSESIPTMCQATDPGCVKVKEMKNYFRWNTFSEFTDGHRRKMACVMKTYFYCKNAFSWKLLGHFIGKIWRIFKFNCKTTGIIQVYYGPHCLPKIC